MNSLHEQRGGWGLAVLLTASLALAQSRTLPPKDESSRDSQFAAFFARFRETVRQKNTEALLRVVSPTIQNDFGGGLGIADFRERWELDKPGTKLWEVLDRLLALGGSFFDPDTYCAPYISVRFPGEFDGFEHVVVVGTGVRLRAEASTASAVRAQLPDYAIVRLLEWGEAWTRVRTLEGTEGFMATQYVYSPIGYRSCFVRTATGEWVMNTLVAGD